MVAQHACTMLRNGNELVCGVQDNGKEESWFWCLRSDLLAAISFNKPEEVEMEIIGPQASKTRSIHADTCPYGQVVRRLRAIFSRAASAVILTSFSSLSRLSTSLVDFLVSIVSKKTARSSKHRSCSSSVSAERHRCSKISSSLILASPCPTSMLLWHNDRFGLSKFTTTYDLVAMRDFDDHHLTNPKLAV